MIIFFRFNNRADTEEVCAFWIYILQLPTKTSKHRNDDNSDIFYYARHAAMSQTKVTMCICVCACVCVRV